MSFVLTIWKTPEGVKPPTGVEQADRLLAQQQGLPAQNQETRFLAFGDALYQRFPPCDDMPDESVWADGSEAGETDESTLTFGLNTQSSLFDAAYSYTVLQAMRMGMNVYDPQSGEHHLADGRRLQVSPEKAEPIDQYIADKAWREAGWAGIVGKCRQAFARGSNTALHDYGMCLREGLGAPRARMLACAVMQVAAAKDDARRRQRLESLKSIPQDLRHLPAALLSRLREADNVLGVIDEELVEVLARREETKPTGGDAVRFLLDKTWNRLREMAEDGYVDAASSLSDGLSFQGEDGVAVRPPWGNEPNAGRRYCAMAAHLGNPHQQVRYAERLLSGWDGGAVDVHSAVYALKWARDASKGYLSPVIERISKRLTSGWDPVADRAHANELMAHARGLQGAERLAVLRRACEQDHPDAWRQLAQCYALGELGLQQDRMVAAGLYLTAQKDMSYTSGELGSRRPATTNDLFSGHEDQDALSLSRMLIAEVDPWPVIARYQQWLQNMEVLEVCAILDHETGTCKSSAISLFPYRQTSQAEVGSPSPATVPSIAAPPASASPPTRASTPIRGLHLGHATLFAGTVGPLFVLLSPTTSYRTQIMGLLVTSLVAVHGAWRCSRELGWSSRWRVVVCCIAALPGVGLAAAVDIMKSKPEKPGE